MVLFVTLGSRDSGLGTRECPDSGLPAEMLKKTYQKGPSSALCVCSVSHSCKVLLSGSDRTRIESVPPPPLPLPLRNSPSCDEQGAAWKPLTFRADSALQVYRSKGCSAAARPNLPRKKCLILSRRIPLALDRPAPITHTPRVFTPPLSLLQWRGRLCQASKVRYVSP